MFHFEEDRHDENRASTSIQLAHLTKKSSKHGSEDYGYDGEGADDGRERKPEENLPLMLLRYITLNITSLFAHAERNWYAQNFPIAQQSLF
ncbi:hypothetical protein T12_12535 [Trichinella patagoniensis]|uniref:Uncharacterized protein n=1 Tax=Trichinella patagoniensis TaxID=990121 RepID=A0A0V0Z5P8_9BILA|nr:hypothetical protein T12_12535 [Trichinella patagoniensis]